jgi:uncharacterized membrane-anchored protein YhcB (DUF1043 family)
MTSLKEEFYIAAAAAIFIVGLVFGAVLCNLLSKDCKTREQLCMSDMQLNKSLKQTLSTQELKCAEKIDKVSETVLKNANQKYLAKYERLKQACNELDCSQCRR